MKATATKFAKFYALAISCIIVFLFCSYVSDLAKAEYESLELERAYKIDMIQVIAGRTGKYADEIVRQPSSWVQSVNDSNSIEIFPVDPITGRSMFPSSLTGEYSHTNTATLNQKTMPTRRMVVDHRGKRVLRVSGARRFGAMDTIVNADVDVIEIVRANKVQGVLFALLIPALWLLIRTLKKIPAQLRIEKSADSDYHRRQVRQLEEVLEKVEVDVCVVEVDENTKKNKIIYTTRGFDLLFRYRIGGLIGKSLEIFLPEDMHEWHRNMVVEAHQKGVHIPARTVTAIRKDGTEMSINLDVKFTGNIDGQSLAVVSVRDQT